MNKIKVSVLIPTYNRSFFLEKALDSTLLQDYENIEIIISDNNSDDNTSELINKYLSSDKISYYKNSENIGMVANWRKCLYEYCTGQFFILLSDDDYFIDNSYISKAVKLIENNNDIVMVYSNGLIYYQDKDETIEMNLPFKEINKGRDIFLTKCQILPQDFTLCNILFKTDLSIKLNAFSDDMNICCDSELFSRMCLNGNVGFIKDKTTVYNMHSNNLIKKFFSNDKYISSDLISKKNIYDEASKIGLFNSNELNNFKKKYINESLESILFRVIMQERNEYTRIYKNISISYPELSSNIKLIFKFKVFLILNFKHMYIFLRKVKNELSYFKI